MNIDWYYVQSLLWRCTANWNIAICISALTATNDAATSCKNLVNFRLVTPEITLPKMHLSNVLWNGENIHFFREVPLKMPGINIIFNCKANHICLCKWHLWMRHSTLNIRSSVILNQFSGKEKVPYTPMCFVWISEQWCPMYGIFTSAREKML